MKQNHLLYLAFLVFISLIINSIKAQQIDTIITNSGQTISVQTSNTAIKVEDQAMDAYYEGNFPLAVFFYKKQLSQIDTSSQFKNDDLASYYEKIAKSYCHYNTAFAISYLQKWLKLKCEFITNYSILFETDFSLLNNYPPYIGVLNELKNRFKISNPNTNSELAFELLRMGKADQYYRNLLDYYENTYGQHSSKADSIMHLMDKTDSLNITEIVPLIDKYGWFTKILVGKEACEYAFLIIQHADSAIQKKYFPLIEASSLKGDIKKSDVALMKDRILVRDGKKQIYGTQIHYDNKTQKYELFPLEDESKVDEWRKEVGLGRLSEYLSQWGIVFPPKK